MTAFTIAQEIEIVKATCPKEDVVEMMPTEFVSTEPNHYDDGPCDGCHDNCSTCVFMID